MREINYHYLYRDYATDVLSFPYNGEEVDGRAFLGEILIAPAIAASDAVRNGISPEEELRKLLVHGTLHLSGYDHETDKGQMMRMQTKILRRKSLRNHPPLAQWE